MLEHPDPALKELRTAYEQSKENPFNPFAFGAAQPRPDFVSAMFHSFDLTPQERQFGIDRPIRSQEFRSQAGDEAQQFQSRAGAETWVFWRAEDQSAHVRTFDQVRDQVKDAWYLEQARKLASKEAQRINGALKKQHLNPADAVKFLREQKQGDIFELTNVAHLQAKVNLLAGHKFTASDFDPYVVPKDRIAYPPTDFVDRLLKLKEPGDSLVLADRPVRHFYVAVLMEKPQVPERREFYDIYNSRGLDNRIWTEMIDARERKYAEKTMAQLRAEATKALDEGGEYVLSDKVRSRGEGGSSDSGE
jgi:hypothetical protein